jgi:hypothetical protein
LRAAMLGGFMSIPNETRALEDEILIENSEPEFLIGKSEFLIGISDPKF